MSDTPGALPGPCRCSSCERYGMLWWVLPGPYRSYTGAVPVVCLGRSGPAPLLYRSCTVCAPVNCTEAVPGRCPAIVPGLHQSCTGALQGGGTGSVLGYHQGSSGAVPRQKELNCTGAVPACTGAAPGWYRVYRGNTCDLQRLSVARVRNLPFPLYMAVSSLPPCVCSTCFCACTRLMSAIVSCCACGCRVLACFSAVPLALSLAVLLRLLPL